MVPWFCLASEFRIVLYNIYIALKEIKSFNILEKRNKTLLCYSVTVKKLSLSFKLHF